MVLAKELKLALLSAGLQRSVRRSWPPSCEALKRHRKSSRFGAHVLFSTHSAYHTGRVLGYNAKTFRCRGRRNRVWLTCLSCLHLCLLISNLSVCWACTGVQDGVAAPDSLAAP